MDEIKALLNGDFVGDNAVTIEQLFDAFSRLVPERDYKKLEQYFGEKIDELAPAKIESFKDHINFSNMIEFFVVVLSLLCKDESSWAESAFVLFLASVFEFLLFPMVRNYHLSYQRRSFTSGSIVFLMQCLLKKKREELPETKKRSFDDFIKKNGLFKESFPMDIIQSADEDFGATVANSFLSNDPRQIRSVCDTLYGLISENKILPQSAGVYLINLSPFWQFKNRRNLNFSAKNYLLSGLYVLMCKYISAKDLPDLFVQESFLNKTYKLLIDTVFNDYAPEIKFLFALLICLMSKSLFEFFGNYAEQLMLQERFSNNKEFMRYYLHVNWQVLESSKLVVSLSTDITEKQLDAALRNDISQDDFSLRIFSWQLRSLNSNLSYFTPYNFFDTKNLLPFITLAVVSVMTFKNNHYKLLVDLAAIFFVSLNNKKQLNKASYGIMKARCYYLWDRLSDLDDPEPEQKIILKEGIYRPLIRYFESGYGDITNIMQVLNNKHIKPKQIKEDIQKLSALWESQPLYTMAPGFFSYVCSAVALYAFHEFFAEGRWDSYSFCLAVKVFLVYLPILLSFGSGFFTEKEDQLSQFLEVYELFYSSRKKAAPTPFRQRRTLTEVDADPVARVGMEIAGSIGTLYYPKPLRPGKPARRHRGTGRGGELGKHAEETRRIREAKGLTAKFG